MIPGVVRTDMRLSRITLALLEDSGWYRPNYDMAEDFLGNNIGCNYVTQSCLGSYNRDDVKEENVFCFQELEQGNIIPCNHKYLTWSFFNQFVTDRYVDVCTNKYGEININRVQILVSIYSRL